jgi:carboxyl-terminal processing protease
VDSKIETVDGHRIGVLTLLSFTDGVHARLAEEVERLVEDGAEGIVLDLRGNGGGLLTESVLAASVFIDDGPIVSTRGRASPQREYDAIGSATDTETPLVVLVDGGTASAAEILTGALRDRGRAVAVVGEKTFGKGVFQEVKPLSNGGAVNLTVGSYYLPDGENLAEDGIKPEVRARDKPTTRRDEALPTALAELAEHLSQR